LDHNEEKNCGEEGYENRENHARLVSWASLFPEDAGSHHIAAAASESIHGVFATKV
jgi:hypothetical protein